MSPLPKLPAYGDAAHLEQLAAGTKQQHGTYGPLVQKNEVGRPSTGQAPQQQAQQQPVDVDPAHQGLMKQAAEAEAARVFWTQYAQQYPGPNSDYYMQQADALAQQAHEALFTATPNFE